MKKLITLLFCGLIALPGISQEPKRCATQDVFLENSLKYPGYKEAVEQAFINAKNYSTIKNSITAKTNTPDTIYRIPVVVHIVYSQDSVKQNLADSIIHSQIEVLNEDYRRSNSDTAITRNVFKPFAGDAGIEFFLADTDPQGNPTSGITRTTTNVNGFGLNYDNVKFDSQGGINAWNPKKYLNIWVCDLSFFGIPVILGIAYPPVGAPNWPTNQFPTDSSFEGVVVHFAVVGRNNPNATGFFTVTDRGRTATHEVGHYLGLRHIWGDGGGFSGTPGCSVDDGIADTPNCLDASQQTCNLTINSCVDSIIDYPDMIENFMDYSEESCMNMFTQGQIGIMRAMLATARVELPEIVTDTAISAIVHYGFHENILSVYPNPSEGKFNMRIEKPVKELTIYNSIGAIIQSSSGNEISHRVTIDLSLYPAGMYFAKARINDQTVVKKLLLK